MTQISTISFVFGHHPTRDPLSTKNSQLNNRKEAELIESWLTEFREESVEKASFISSGTCSYCGC